MIRQSNSWTYCVHWCILKPNVILGTRLPVQCSSNFKDCTCKILQNVYWWDSSVIGCRLHMWNVFQTWSQEDAATGLWSPPGLGSQLQSIDLSDFSFLFWERCYRSVLSDLHWGTAKWLRQVWCRGGICSIWQGNLYCFFHFDELKVLMSFFGDGTVFLVQGTRKSMGHICKFHDNWPSRKEASREAGPPLVFISVTITPILNLASPNHICNLSFTNSSFFRPSTPLFFNP